MPNDDNSDDQPTMEVPFPTEAELLAAGYVPIPTDEELLAQGYVPIDFTNMPDVAHLLREPGILFRCIMRSSKRAMCQSAAANGVS